MTTNDRNPSVYGTLSSTRTLKPLRDLCVQKIGIQTGPFGSQLHNSDYVSIGVPIITVEHLGENIIDGKDAPLVSTEDAARLARYTLETGDIVFSRVGSVDRRSIVSTSQRGWLFSGRLLRVRPNHELVNSTFLSYFFGLESFKSYIRSIAVGTTMPSLNTELLSTVPVIVPAMEEQKVIAAVLSSLDEKIRLNTEISKTLEAVAQTIFKSWFIDFDPVHAKMRGEKPEGMDDATAALFPDSFEESELGLIPKGWEVEAFGEMVTLLMGQSPPGDTYNDAGEGLPFYQGKTDFGSRFPSRRMYCTAGKRIAVKGETLISVRAPVGDINQATEKCIIGRGVASALHKSRSEAYTFCLLSSLKPVLDFYNGEGSVFGAINGKDFSSLPIVEPPQSLVDCFNDVASPINDQIRNLFDEINNLISIRDALLPRLISGELQIPDEMLAS